MPFVVDLLPPSAKIETAVALALAMRERKSRGLFGRRQTEPVEVLARFGYPLRTIAWGEEADGRCLVFDRQGLVSGRISFALAADAPEFELNTDAGEEAFVRACQQMTREVANLAPVSFSFVGFIDQPAQALSLLDGEHEPLLADLEERANPQEVLDQLSQQLAAYRQAAEAWSRLKQSVYAHRDSLSVKLQEQIGDDRDRGAQSLADMSSQLDTAIAAKRAETEAALAVADKEFQDRRQMLLAELERFQENYREKADNYWRDQIKNTEDALSKLDKGATKTNGDLKGAFEEFERQQNAKLKAFKNELAKRQTDLTSRLERLNSAVDTFGKGCDERLQVYARQSDRVRAVTLELSRERAQKLHNAVFYAARYPGGRWKVFPPQSLGARSIFGAAKLPFKPASRLAENLASALAKILPASELADRLAENNLMDGKDFHASAKEGLTELVDRGKLNKKQQGLFDELTPREEDKAPGLSSDADKEE